MLFCVIYSGSSKYVQLNWRRGCPKMSSTSYVPCVIALLMATIRIELRRCVENIVIHHWYWYYRYRMGAL